MVVTDATAKVGAEAQGGLSRQQRAAVEVVARLVLKKAVAGVEAGSIGKAIGGVVIGATRLEELTDAVGASVALRAEPSGIGVVASALHEKPNAAACLATRGCGEIARRSALRGRVGCIGTAKALAVERVANERVARQRGVEVVAATAQKDAHAVGPAEALHRVIARQVVRGVAEHEDARAKEACALPCCLDVERGIALLVDEHADAQQTEALTEAE